MIDLTFVNNSPRSILSADDRRTRGSQRLLHFLAAASILTGVGMAAPSAHAQTPRLITYFNFEDSVQPTPNLVSDPANPPPEQSSTITFGATGTSGPTSVSAVAGTTLNTAPGNIQGTGSALRLTENKRQDAAYIQFTVNTLGLQSLSLSYATQATLIFKQTLSYSLTGSPGTFMAVGTQTVTSSFSIITFDLTSVTAVNNQPTVTFRLTIDPVGVGGNNSGATADFDNIQLKGVPEPATVASGALCLLGLCWHQRRRLLTIPRFLGAG